MVTGSVIEGLIGLPWSQWINQLQVSVTILAWGAAYYALFKWMNNDIGPSQSGDRASSPTFSAEQPSGNERPDLNNSNLAHYRRNH